MIFSQKYIKILLLVVIVGGVMFIFSSTTFADASLSCGASAQYCPADAGGLYYEAGPSGYCPDAWLSPNDQNGSTYGLLYAAGCNPLFFTRSCTNVNDGHQEPGSGVCQQAICNYNDGLGGFSVVVGDTCFGGNGGNGGSDGNPAYDEIYVKASVSDSYTEGPIFVAPGNTIYLKWDGMYGGYADNCTILTNPGSRTVGATPPTPQVDVPDVVNSQVTYEMWCQGYLKDSVTVNVASDLTAGSPTISFTNSNNTQISSITAPISNINSIGVASSFPNLLQVDTGNNGSVDYTMQTSLASLSANSTSNVSFSGSPLSTLAPGTYAVRACADLNTSSVGSITESNENNNCGSWVIFTVNNPSTSVDLKANGSNGPVTISNNTTVSLSWTVSNASSCTASAAPSDSLWSGSKSSTGGTQNSSALTNSTTYSISCTGGGGTATDSVTVNVQQIPDLTAGSPTPSTATANVAQTYTATISNIGNASTGTSFSNFFQTATAANGGGTITGYPASSMSTLAAGASNTATSPSITFASAGTYSVRACADKVDAVSTGSITEADEDNNCGTWTNVTVSAIPVPVVTISANPTSGTAGSVNPTITWSVTNNPTSCTATGDWSGSKAASGSQSQGVLNTVKTYTYTLTCSNGGGTGTPQSATVVVSNAPVDGVCGTANNKSYPYSATDYGSDTQCAPGNSTNTAFPPANGSTNWVCLGLFNGSPSGQCTASRAPNTSALQILKTNAQGGIVSSADNNINCGGTCSYSYAIGSTVTLTATPISSYWQFTGWTGSVGTCSGTGATCTFTITSSSQTAQANFAPRTFNYTEF